MRSALLLLPVLLLPAACSGESWTHQSHGYSFTTTFSEGNATRIDIAQDGNTRKIRAVGKIDLGEGGHGVLLLSPGATFGIKDDGWDGKRQLDITRAADGASLYRYKLEGVEQEFDAAAQEWFAGVVIELRRMTTIGAEARAERILAERGADALIAEIGETESNGAARIYVRVLMKQPGLSSEQLSTTVDLVARNVSSSSTLEEILVDIADQHTGDETLTAKVVEAAGRISSSSSQGEVLEAVVRNRRLSAATAASYYRTVARISSSSTKEEVLETAIDFAPRDDASMRAFFDAADAISSSSSHGEVLEAALNRGELSPAGRLRWIESVSTISSTSTKEDLLKELFHATPHDPAVLTAALGAVRGLSSSSSQESCLRAFLSRDGLDKALLREAEKAIDTVSSSSTRTELQDILLEKLFALGD